MWLVDLLLGLHGARPLRLFRLCASAQAVDVPAKPRAMRRRLEQESTQESV